MFHYTSIMKEQDECPLLLCYSRGNGTGKALIQTKCMYAFITNQNVGKTTALKMAMSIYGVTEENGNSPGTSPSSLLMQAATTTLPLGLLQLIQVSIMSCMLWLIL